MGIESDKLVLDYLSRVGDLAQTAMPAGDRMRLVAKLRNDIDSARGRTAGDSPAAVRRILGRIGSPDEVVDAASGTAAAQGHPAPAPRPATPEPPAREGGTGGLLRKAFGPGGAPGGGRTGGDAPGSGGGRLRKAFGTGGSGTGGDRAPGARAGASGSVPGARMTPPPGVNEILAGAGASGDGPEGWGTGGGPGGEGMLGGDFSPAGWSGGLIMSEFQRPAPPPAEERPPAGEPGTADGGHLPGSPLAPAAPVPAAAVEAVRRTRTRKPLLPKLLRPRQAPEAAAPVAAEPEAPRQRIPVPALQVLAAAVLVAGAVLGNVIVLAAGWLLAYATRGADRRRAQMAALGVPGAVVLGAIVWFWGRASGHWGPPIGPQGTGAVFSADIPVVLRVAACASAAYLLWRGLVKRA